MWPPITEVGYGMKAAHKSCSMASPTSPPSKRLTCWKSTLCPTQKLADGWEDLNILVTLACTKVRAENRTFDRRADLVSLRI
jgi:hypothetical protein